MAYVVLVATFFNSLFTAKSTGCCKNYTFRSFITHFMPHINKKSQISSFKNNKK